ncbi:MAG: hypothetical protein JF612_12610, partial [Planctomycetia bacterium]|nr:hypothetical protein [Planctomycetia bacterium]
MTNGTLFINEGQFSTGANQAVEVAELADHRIRVTGLVPPGGGATFINGANSVVFSHPTDIVIGTGAGDDVVNLIGTNVRNIQILAEGSSLSVRDSDTVSLLNVHARGVVDIRTGPLIDRVFIQNSTIGDNIGNDDLKISTGVPSAAGQSDMDTVNLKGVTTRSATMITTGASTDIVDIEDSTLGNDSNDFLTIQTGAGADSVAIAPPAGQSGNYQSVGGNVVIQTFDSESEQDDDKVRMQQLNFHSALVRLGAGNDT